MLPRVLFLTLALAACAWADDAAAAADADADASSAAVAVADAPAATPTPGRIARFGKKLDEERVNKVRGRGQLSLCSRSRRRYRSAALLRATPRCPYPPLPR